MDQKGIMRTSLANRTCAGLRDSDVELTRECAEKQEAEPFRLAVEPLQTLHVQFAGKGQSRVRSAGRTSPSSPPSQPLLYSFVRVFRRLLLEYGHCS